MKIERSVADSIVSRPDEIDVIKDEAKKLIQKAGVAGIFPTSIDKLLEAANVDQITDIEEAHKSFLQTASAETGAYFRSAINKIRGFADLKKRINYVAPEPMLARRNWVRLHELGHQHLYWQRDASAFIEDNRSLSPECEDEFEREANAFAGETLFQGEVFLDVAGSLRPDFNSVFALANQFGASRHCAARQMATESDEALALVSYFKSTSYLTEDGRSVLALGKSHSASHKLLKRYSNLKIPLHLTADHPWAQAMNGEIQSGSQQFDCGDGTTSKFLWEAWWNSYNLLVLIRRAPKFKVVKDIFDF